MKTLTSFLTILFAIFIIPSCTQDNHVPEIADQTFYLDENSEAGTILGVIEAQEPDEEGGLTFDIVEGNTDNQITIEYFENNSVTPTRTNTILFDLQ